MNEIVSEGRWRNRVEEAGEEAKVHERDATTDSDAHDQSLINTEHVEYYRKCQCVKFDLMQSKIEWNSKRGIWQQELFLKDSRKAGVSYFSTSVILFEDGKGMGGGGQV